MREKILRTLELIEKLSRAVERGDTDLSDFREEVLKFYQEVNSK